MMIIVPIERFEVDQLGENSCIADLVDSLCEHQGLNTVTIHIVG